MDETEKSLMNYKLKLAYVTQKPFKNVTFYAIEIIRILKWQEGTHKSAKSFVIEKQLIEASK